MHTKQVDVHGSHPMKSVSGSKNATIVSTTCCREKIGELLSQVCSGVSTQELPAALQGLLAAAAHVRAAAIVALLDVPAFAEGTLFLPSPTRLKYSLGVLISVKFATWVPVPPCLSHVLCIPCRSRSDSIQALRFTHLVLLKTPCLLY